MCWYIGLEREVALIDIKVGGGGGEALEGSLVSYNNGRGKNEKKV